MCIEIVQHFMAITGTLLFIDRDDVDLRRLPEERQGVLDGAARLRGIFPADGYVFGLDVIEARRRTEHGTTQPHDSLARIDNEPTVLTVMRFSAPNHNEVGDPGIVEEKWHRESVFRKSFDPAAMARCLENAARSRWMYFWKSSCAAVTLPSSQALGPSAAR